MLPKPVALMGILNVTPDSFSDGGKFNNTQAAVHQALTMVKAGATIIDIGGESSRPGAKPVLEQEELKRVIPVIKALRKKSNVTISIDTYKPAVAQAALAVGASMVNDISGLRDTAMRQVVARTNCNVVLMHMLGTPGTMQLKPHYKNVVREVHSYFRKQITLARAAGIKRKNIILDPGIGFGKTVEHNVQLLNHLDAFLDLKLPILIGASRKSFIGKITGASVEDRLPGTIAAHLLAVNHGATILRVHDVAEHVQALTTYGIPLQQA